MTLVFRSTIFERILYFYKFWKNDLFSPIFVKKHSKNNWSKERKKIAILLFQEHDKFMEMNIRYRYLIRKNDRNSIPSGIINTN